MAEEMANGGYEFMEKLSQGALNGGMFYVVLFSMILTILAVVIVVSDIGGVHLENYEKVSIGMSEEEMIKIMGKKYNKSSFKGNRFKYEWRINGTSTSFGGTRFYSNVRKVDIC